MSIALKPGTRLFGAACQTELIVVKSPAEAIDLRIGGHPPLRDPQGREPGLVVTTAPDAAPKLGKRYVDETGSLELLCTKAGDGAISVGDVDCVVKDAKPLPASD